MEINAIGVKNYVIWPRGGSGLTGLRPEGCDRLRRWVMFAAAQRGDVPFRPEGCGIAHGATAWPGFIGFTLWANGGRG